MKLQIAYYDQKDIQPFLPEMIRMMKFSDATISDPWELAHVWMVRDLHNKDKLVAFAGCEQFHGFWCMLACLVHPDYRGQGIQRRLITVRLEFLRLKNAKHVNCWVRLTNTPSLKNLLAAGFIFLPGGPKRCLGKYHQKMRLVFKSMDHQNHLK